MTKALQKPFSFEERSNLRRSRSLSALDTDNKKRKNEEKPKFFARPMPHRIFEYELWFSSTKEVWLNNISVWIGRFIIIANMLQWLIKSSSLYYTITILKCCIWYNYSPEVDERAKEEEAYRQIRIKMRAEQLLAESQLPSNMKRYAIHYTGTVIGDVYITFQYNAYTFLLCTPGPCTVQCTQ